MVLLKFLVTFVHTWYILALYLRDYYYSLAYIANDF